MLLTIEKLNLPVSIELSGDEAWLDKIYAMFPSPKGASQPKLTASLHISSYEHGVVDVRGRFDYRPYVNCSRCADPIQWHLSESFDVRYRHHPDQDLPKEHNLLKEELDHYYFTKDAVDLEELLNELVQVALPTTLVLVNANEESCQVCHDDLRKTEVYEDPNVQEKPNPFEVLKHLKDNDSK